MGRHDEERGRALWAQLEDLEVLHLQAWHVGDRTQISTWGAYKTDEGSTSRPWGSHLLPYQMLHLPSLGQVLWTLGDELRASWADLTPDE